ncbi:MAG: class I SAM-dependent methyltransferase [Bacteroidales bacterium]|nr:class I SAM-dependent methyltransferase [Bacteroidales bacterium]MBN2750820.1 class I SAM-dependent methyltransferase [Bacteroidales bacterium]
MINIKERCKLLKRYVVYRFRAKMRGGHGIHSPFLFQLYNSVLYSKVNCSYNNAPQMLVRLLESSRMAFVASAQGAQSKVSAPKSIKRFAAAAAISRADGMLLYRLVKHLQPQTIVELGTGAGVGTAFMASAATLARVYTIEANSQLVAVNRANFAKVGLENIECIEGAFSLSLPKLLSDIGRVDLAFVDGDHTYDATLANVELILSKSHSNTVVAIHDIHWSDQMEKAWNELKCDERVTIAVDFFTIGLLFLRKGIAKHSVVLRY